MIEELFEATSEPWRASTSPETHAVPPPSCGATVRAVGGASAPCSALNASALGRGGAHRAPAPTPIARTADAAADTHNGVPATSRMVVHRGRLGFQYVDEVDATGAPVAAGTVVKIHYTALPPIGASPPIPSEFQHLALRPHRSPLRVRRPLVARAVRHQGGLFPRGMAARIRHRPPRSAHLGRSPRGMKDGGRRLLVAPSAVPATLVRQGARRGPGAAVRHRARGARGGLPHQAHRRDLPPERAQLGRLLYTAALLASFIVHIAGRCALRRLHRRRERRGGRAPPAQPPPSSSAATAPISTRSSVSPPASSGRPSPRAPSTKLRRRSPSIDRSDDGARARRELRRRERQEPRPDERRRRDGARGGRHQSATPCA